jgi:GNAT superfamily N-acetyltransferase
MPIAEDPGRPGGRILTDASGAEIARFVAKPDEEREVADLLELSEGVRPDRAAPVVMGELRGWRVAAREPFGRLLEAGGARTRRHAHVMSRDLVRDAPPPAWLEPALPDGIRLTPVDRPALDLAAACAAAYPTDHPDFDHIPDPAHPEIELDEIVSGRLMGPLLRCSGLAVGEEAAVVGAILVNATPGEPPFGGPWIAQLFRAPGAHGVGAALLRRALATAARDGLPALGLAVTHGNPAARLYAEHGFNEVLDSLSVEL